jgi:hypothetical protein
MSWRDRCMAITAVWLTAHGVMVVLTMPMNDRPEASIAALVLLVVVSMAAIHRVSTGGVIHPGQAWMLAASVVVVGLLVTPFLSGRELLHYPNWWPGAVGPALVCLAWSRKQLPAASAAAAGIALLVGAVVIDAQGGPVDTVATIMMCGPLVLAVAGTVRLRSVFERAAEEVAFYAARESEAYLQTAQSQARADTAATRRSELLNAAGQTLRLLASAPQGESAQLRMECRRIESRLRDLLAARTMLSSELRVAAEEARDRGVHLTMTDDRDRPTPDQLTAAAGDALVTVLGQLCGGQARLRLGPGHYEATLVAQATVEDLTAVKATLDDYPPAERVTMQIELDVETNTVFIELNVEPDDALRPGGS